MILLNEDIIVKAMIEEEISWEDLSRKCGISVKTLRKMREDVTKANLDTILKVAEALNLNVKDILEEL